MRRNPYIDNWEENRQNEIKELTGKGVIPVEHDIESMGDDVDDDTMDNARPFLMGKVAAVVNKSEPAKKIIDDMVSEAAKIIQQNSALIVGKAKL